MYVRRGLHVRLQIRVGTATVGSNPTVASFLRRRCMATEGRHEVLKTKCQPLSFAINAKLSMLVGLNFLCFHPSMRLL